MKAAENRHPIKSRRKLDEKLNSWLTSSKRRKSVEKIRWGFDEARVPQKPRINKDSSLDRHLSYCAGTIRSDIMRVVRPA
jgi:hypothetical protein